MFMESWPWKRDLALSADRLEKARLGLSDRISSHTESGDAYKEEIEVLYQVERDVMAGAFAIRRLIGMPSKVTKAARTSNVTVMRFPLGEGEKTPDHFDALGSLEIYEMASPQTVTTSANEMCNLFVHSLIFRLAWTFEGLPWEEYWHLPETDPRCEIEPTELAGFLVASDKSSRDHLAFVSLAELLRVFRVFANDEVTHLRGRRDKAGRMHMTAI